MFKMKTFELQFVHQLHKYFFLKNQVAKTSLLEFIIRMCAPINITFNFYLQIFGRNQTMFFSFEYQLKVVNTFKENKFSFNFQFKLKSMTFVFCILVMNEHCVLLNKSFNRLCFKFTCKIYHQESLQFYISYGIIEIILGFFIT